MQSQKWQINGLVLVIKKFKVVANCNFFLDTLVQIDFFHFATKIIFASWC